VSAREKEREMEASKPQNSEMKGGRKRDEEIETEKFNCEN
jgi:hypothetical protein